MLNFRSFLLLCFFSAFSFSAFADTGSSLEFIEKKSQVESKFESLKGDLSSNTDNDVIELLQCMQIPFPIDDPAYGNIFKELESDFSRDFSSFQGDPTLSDTIRLDFYTTSLSSLESSLQKDRNERKLVVDNIVVKNQSFFDQISSDRKVLKSLISEYDSLSKEISTYKVMHGYSIGQYIDLTSQYRQILSTNLESNLGKVQYAYLKKRSDFNGFEEFSEEKKDIYVQKFSNDADDFFNQKIANILDLTLIQEYDKQIKSIKESFYTDGVLQCGLLTELTKDNRMFYQKLLENIVSQRALLSSIFSNKIDNQNENIVIINSEEFTQDLKSRYSNLLSEYFSLYVKELKSQSSLFTKATRGEKRSLNELRILINQYDESTEQDKNIIKKQILSQISILEKDIVISKRVQKSLDSMKERFK